MNALNAFMYRFPIGQRIGALVGLLLLTTSVIGLVAINAMSRIGHEITAIAEHDLPLVEHAAEITVLQLEENISFGTVLRLGEQLEQDRAEGAAQAKFEAARQEFQQTAMRVDQQIAAASEKTAEINESIDSQESSAAWTRVLGKLEKAASAHANYLAHAATLFDMLAAGNSRDFDSKLQEVEAESGLLRQHAKELSEEVSSFTERAALTAQADEASAIDLIVIVGIAAVAIGIMLSFLTVRAITSPLRRIMEALDALREGDTTREIEARGRDEVARLARAYEIFRARTIEAERLRQEQEATKQRAAEEKRQMMMELADRFQTDVASIVDIVVSTGGELNDTAISMGQVAMQTSQQASTVSSAAEQSAASTHAVASATEELTNSVQEIASKMSQSSARASEAVQLAGKASSQVGNLADAAEKIGSVIRLIQDIAERTNLLALNATIEAARAGEAGKGFAVVAQEVKELAGQTAGATDDIYAQINLVQSETRNAVVAIENISASINEIHEYTSSISAAVEEQGAATQEIARNIQEASIGAQQVTENIVGVNHAVRETESSARQVEIASGKVVDQAGNLKSQVHHFLERVRAA